MLASPDDLLSVVSAVYAPDDPPREFCRAMAVREIKAGQPITEVARARGFSAGSQDTHRGSKTVVSYLQDITSRGS